MRLLLKYWLAEGDECDGEYGRDLWRRDPGAELGTRLLFYTTRAGLLPSTACLRGRVHSILWDTLQEAPYDIQAAS